MKKRYIAAYISISLIALAFVMSFFGRTHAPNVVLVTEQQELPDPNAHYSAQSGLQERISKSYGLALVLVISEYTRKNAIALEAIRKWAHENFHQDPAFLHAPEVVQHRTAHDTVLDAFCFSLFAPPRYFLEQQALNLLRNQIALFHTTRAYEAFRADYFDSFGLDKESANMLARYQSERARNAVSVLLSAVYWLLAAGLGAALHFRAHSAERSTSWQRSIAFFWFSLSLFYITVGWAQNDVSVLVSSIVCLLFGLYLRRPIAISFGEDKGLSFRLLMPTPAVLAGATWISFTLLCVQLLTWMKTGTLANSDPITLLVSAVTGDFLHDHATAKWYISRVIGCLWVVVTGTCAFAAAPRWRSSEIEQSLKAINDQLQ